MTKTVLLSLVMMVMTAACAGPQKKAIEPLSPAATRLPKGAKELTMEELERSEAARASERRDQERVKRIRDSAKNPPSEDDYEKLFQQF